MSRPPRKSPSPLPPPLSVLGEPGASRTQHAIIPPSMPTRYHRDYTFARKTIDGWKFHRYSKFRPLLLRLDQLESSQPRKFVLYARNFGREICQFFEALCLCIITLFHDCFVRFSNKFKNNEFKRKRLKLEVNVVMREETLVRIIEFRCEQD